MPFHISACAVYKKAAVIINCLPVIAIITCLFSAQILQAQDKKTSPGIFYAVSGNGLKDSSWLFGTYHLVNSSYLDEVPAVSRAFKKSKGLVVELVIDSTKLPAVQSMGMLKNKTLSGMLDKPFSDSLDIELKAALGAGLPQLDQLKPMNVSLILSIVYLMKNNKAMLDKYTGSPLDAGFVQLGKTTMKDIKPLETMEEQLNFLFNGTTDEEQVKQLKLFLRNKNEAVRMGDELLRQWFNHDINSMYNIYTTAAAYSGERDDLLKNRNYKWMKQLPGLLAKESQFIAVGALHLAGPDGLVKQLQQLGYTVTPVKL